MVVIQAIKNSLTFPAKLHQLVVFQNAKLVAHGTLGHAQEPCNVIHAQLRAEQHIEYLDPGGVAKHLVKLRQIIQIVLVGHLLAHGLHAALVQTQELLVLALFHLFHIFLLKCSYE